jgi:hypothetical protein
MVKPASTTEISVIMIKTVEIGRVVVKTISQSAAARSSFFVFITRALGKKPSVCVLCVRVKYDRALGDSG